jgi:hypothetical protein
MLTSPATAPYTLLARSFFVILGCFAVLWGIIELPAFWRDVSIKRIATQIIAGDPFKIETLTQQVPTIDSIKRSAYCRPAALHSTAIIELRMWEISASAKDREHRNEQFKTLGNAIRGSLSCAPADPFLWLALYSVEVNEEGLQPDYLKYLRQSYRLGPREGWIVSKRNPLAFGAFQQLPPDLRENAIDEFFAMVRDPNFSGQAAEILIGPAWPERELILSRLTSLSDRDGRRFAGELYIRGYDLNVPGVGLAPRDSHRFAPEIRVPQ